MQSLLAFQYAWKRKCVKLCCRSRNDDIKTKRKPNPNETFYDILRVKKNCSHQDIRNAFVKLSKEFHPDVKGGSKADPQDTAEFVKISEAYKTLSKPKLRTRYDQLLSTSKLGYATYVNDRPMRNNEPFRPWEVRPDYDPNPGPYYGIKGFNRVSNMKIALALIALTVFGAVFGFVSVRHSFTFNRQQLDDISAEANQHHATVRADAVKYGNDEQLRRMLERMARNE